MAKTSSGKGGASGGVKRFVLPNGLTVVAAVNRASPVIEILLHVNTGYCWEPDRYQGLSHVVEHNLMQASARRSTRADFSLERRAMGAFYDAGTGYDFTEYLMIIEPRALDAAMDLLCDGFFFTEFREDTFRSEMGAILQESRRKEDLPKPMALEKLYEAAYRRGRRRRWRLGTAESLGRLTVKDLRRYFRERYGPGNIVLAIGGDLDPEDVARRVRRVFGAVPAAPVRGAFEKPEPPQKEPQYLEVRKPIGGAYWNAGFHAPEFLQEGWMPVKILATVLGAGRGSRLSRTVKDGLGLVDSIEAFAPDHDEYGLLVLEAETDPARLPRAEEAILEELARVRLHGVSGGELERARALVEASFWKDLGDVRKHIDWLALYELRAGGLRNAAGHLKRLLSVTEKDLRETAETVLRPGNLSVCAVLPEGNALPGRSAKTLAAVAKRADAAAAASAPPEGPKASRARPAPVPLALPQRPAAPRAETLADGSTLVVRANRGVPLFAAQVLFRGGRAVEEPGQAGITAMATSAMLRGAGGLSGTEIALRSESLGVEISSVAGADAFGFAVEGRASAFEEAMELLAKVVAEPAFERDSVEKEREAALSRIRAGGDNPRAWVMETFEEAVFAGHPYGNPTRGSETAIRSLEARDLARWHAASVTRANLVLAAGGDVTFAKAAAALRRRFGRLPPGKRVEVRPWAPPASEVIRTEIRALRQTNTAVGFAAVPLADPDFEALDVLAWMSRGDGGRFYDEIRAKRGLAYVVHAVNIGRARAGGFLGFTGTSPETAEEAERILMAEFARFAKEPPSEEELERTKRLALGMRALSLRTEAAVIRSLGEAVAAGVAPDRWVAYRKIVEAVTREDIVRIAADHFRPERRVKVQVMGKAEAAPA